MGIKQKNGNNFTSLEVTVTPFQSPSNKTAKRSSTKQHYLLPGVLIFALVTGIFLYLGLIKPKKISWPPKDILVCLNNQLIAGHTQEECYTYLAIKEKNEAVCSHIALLQQSDCRTKVQQAKTKPAH